MKIQNPMPLVHQARRFRDLYPSNPFVGLRELRAVAGELEETYASLPACRWQRAVKVEIDLLDSVEGI